MKDKSLFEYVGEFIKDVGLTLLAILLFSAFIAALFAPMFYRVLSAPIVNRILATDDENERKKLRKQCKILKAVLWILAVLAWGMLFWTNLIFQFKTESFG